MQVALRTARGSRLLPSASRALFPPWSASHLSGWSALRPLRHHGLGVHCVLWGVGAAMRMDRGYSPLLLLRDGTARRLR